MGRFLYIAAIVLVIIWAISFLGGLIISSFIHLILLLAVILVVVNLFGHKGSGAGKP